MVGGLNAVYPVDISLGWVRIDWRGKGFGSSGKRFSHLSSHETHDGKSNGGMQYIKAC